ncbi:PEGA domain-containing protein [Alkalimarinus alittae]|uniref:PEGA domain-containing protein n=1 Tax=Alkalimarinus alittae TaxID=2961619 RepID=A0ABY6MY13_9ALTE|nr:PEGA domain-containing protein [Alkalimarinus alittae]UZE94721.1 PEGA domain-containing protein [Alkalimarinus alittae]
MVDVRPLIFANALFLMLLVTAGFAHISSENPFSGSNIPTTNVSEPNNKTAVTSNSSQQKTTDHDTINNDSPAISSSEQVAKTPQPEAETTPISDDQIFADNTEQADNQLNESNTSDTQRDTATALNKAETELTTATQGINSAESAAVATPETVIAVAPIVAAPIPTTSPTPQPEVVKVEPKPKPKPIATTGKLIIRSNIEGDMVLINGKPYGPTRLEVELEPGNYAIEVAKSGYSSWQADVSVLRGKQQTLKAKLEHYTTVNYKNGEWINGITTGEGSYLSDDGIQYQGAFVNGKFHGIGSITYPDGTEYRGQWFEGVMQGDGTLITSEGDTFIGIFKDGEFNGEGTLTKANGDIYDGYWVNGSLNGQGSLTTKDGLLFVGGFSENQFHGEGSLTYPDGRHYEGSFSKGQFHGKGVEIYTNGKKYAGQFMEGQYHGKGELMNPNGSKITGTFKFGLPFGKATLTTPEGEIFTARTTEPGVCYRLKSYRATQCPPMEGW